MRLLGFVQKALFGYAQAYDRAPARGGLKTDAAAEQFGPFPHGHHPQTPPAAVSAEASATVLDFEFEAALAEVEAHPGFLRARVARDIVQCFLQYAIDVNRRIAADGKRRPAFLVGYANSGLSFHHRQVPRNRLLQS